MELTTVQRLKMYIEDEERDAILYKELSNIAPNSKDRELLFDIAVDEQIHSDTFKRILKTLTGRPYSPLVTPPEIVGSFEEIIKARILEENEGYRKYSDQYFLNEKNQALREAFFKAKTDELAHAIQLIYMGL